MYYGYRLKAPWVEIGENLYRNSVTGQLLNAKLKRYAKNDPKTGKTIMQNGSGGWVPIDWNLFSSPGVCLLGVCSSGAFQPIPPPPPRPTAPTTTP